MSSDNKEVGSEQSTEVAMETDEQAVEEQGDEEDEDDDQDADGDEDGEVEEDEDEDENPLQHLPEYVIHRVERLRSLHDKREHIMADYLAERAALEYKFGALLNPLFQERNSIVQGEMDDEIAKDHAGEETTDAEEAQADHGAPVKGIPQFWLCAMMHNETTAELITEDDVDCLEKLCNVTCVDREDGKGFTLHFHFAPNDYFTNEVLTKTYEVPNMLLPDEPLLKNVQGTPIAWKDGRSLTFRMVKKKQRGKGKHAGQVRTVEKQEDLESFFRWFEPPEMPPMDELDEEEASRLEEIYDNDYEVAQAFRYQLIPQAVVYFTGEVGDDHVTLAMDGEDVDDE
ncbi:hypothetical protein MPSEU_000387000 [Mayamaea pseudoterrestris]|nr:hypothetical protein MPSEU_000387000 [Mayamaea pseudoterrestris]